MIAWWTGNGLTATSKCNRQAKEKMGEHNASPGGDHTV